MKAFVFLYPIKPYFNACLNGTFKTPKKNNCNFTRINDIIHVRYRKRKYSIYWVMFSKENGSKDPDLFSLDLNHIKMKHGDTIIASGISFKTHTEERKYPDPEFILCQIPELTEIIVGGFHQWDCVDKLASHAYQRGIAAFVDEDTTELFFSRTSVLGDIPIVRKKLTPEEIGFDGRGLELELFRSLRKNKPWFVQI